MSRKKQYFLQISAYDLWIESNNSVTIALRRNVTLILILTLKNLNSLGFVRFPTPRALFFLNMTLKRQPSSPSSSGSHVQSSQIRQGIPLPSYVSGFNLTFISSRSEIRDSTRSHIFVSFPSPAKNRVILRSEIHDSTHSYVFVPFALPKKNRVTSQSRAFAINFHYQKDLSVSAKFLL